MFMNLTHLQAAGRTVDVWHGASNYRETLHPENSRHYAFWIKYPITVDLIAFSHVK
jgi:hypothetical protein